MWMLHQFALEYGHHVQALTGILQADANLQYDAPDQDSALELVRRKELQASCFSDIFIGSNKRSYPITGQSLAQWKWLIGDVTDPNNDHGDPQNHKYWATRGFNGRNPSVCNLFTASSAKVQ
jgi:predicted metalloprotease